MILRPPRSPLFPYTTLCRSRSILARLYGRIPDSAAGACLALAITLSIAGILPAAAQTWPQRAVRLRSEEHTSELQSRQYLVCRLLLEKKKTVTHVHLHARTT